jgi:hypothetical protein
MRVGGGAEQDPVLHKRHLLASIGIRAAQADVGPKPEAIFAAHVDARHRLQHGVRVVELEALQPGRLDGVHRAGGPLLGGANDDRRKFPGGLNAGVWRRFGQARVSASVGPRAGARVFRSGRILKRGHTSTVGGVDLFATVGEGQQRCEEQRRQWLATPATTILPVDCTTTARAVSSRPPFGETLSVTMPLPPKVVSRAPCGVKRASAKTASPA